MKQILFTGLTMLGMAVASLSVYADAPASRLLNEDFDYAVGSELYNQNNNSGSSWVKYGTDTSSPIKVMSGSLTYTGYSEGIGNSVELGTANRGQDLYKGVEAGKEIKSGSVYASLLINVTEAPVRNQAYFFDFVAQTKNGMSDGKSGSEYGKLYVFGNPDDNDQDKCDGTYKLGISRMKDSNSAKRADMDLNFGTTYLVVVKYTFVDGDNNDVVELFINPVTDGTEPAATLTYEGVDGDCSANSGILGVELRQGTTSKNNGPKVQVDAVRMSTSWAGIFDANAKDPDVPTDPEVKDASLTVTPAQISLTNPFAGYTYPIAGMKIEKVVKVKAAGLTGDITITCEDGITATPATIAKDAAGLADGIDVKLTIVPDKTEYGFTYDRNVVFSSSGVQSTTVKVTSPMVLGCSSVPDCKAVVDAQYMLISDKYPLEMSVSGNVIVTYIDHKDGYDLVYVQDDTAGLCLNTSMLTNGDSGLAVGDEISNFTCKFEDTDNGITAVMLPMAKLYDRTATGKTPVPTLVNFDNFDSKYNHYKVIRINNAEFTATGNFEAVNYDVTCDGKAAKVQPFAGTDLIGSPIIAKADVTGISLSNSGVVVAPRKKGDVVAAGETPDQPASVDVTTEVLFDFEELGAVKINESTPLVKFVVKAANLRADAPVSLIGGKTEYFTVTPAVIPAGTSETEVVVSMNAKEIGNYSTEMRINFSETNPDFNFSHELLNCMAYDPQNPPTLTLEPGELLIYAEPSTKESKEVSLIVENAIDTIYVTTTEEEKPYIYLSAETFSPTVHKHVMIVTFDARQIGDRERDFTFSTLMGNHVTLKVKGTTTVQPDPGSVEGISGDANGLYTIYNIQGMRVAAGVDAEAVRNLPAGMYIVNGKKLVKK